LVIAGPTGSGKSSVIEALVARLSNAKFITNATTRQMRVGEVDGESYHFMSNDKFLEELKNGNILEYYHRTDTDTYYGTYRPDIVQKMKDGNIVISQIQIVGAKYLKENFNATTIFILPESLDVIERRVKDRAGMSEEEWAERLSHFKREMEQDIDFYDYKITNKEGELNKTVDAVIEIMHSEGFELKFID
jgi:guanylate kinase